MKQRDALAMLRSADHGFFDPTEATQIAAAFGLTITLQKHRVDSKAHKGLTVPGAEDGEMVSGYDAADLAERIARHVCGFRSYQMGRGFRLRSACDAIEKHLA